MAKRRLPPPARQSNMRLDSPLDTSGTHVDGVVGSSRQGGDNYVTEKVEPAFKGAKQDVSPRWFSDIPPLAKATAAILAVIIAIGAPSVWWMARLDTNVDNLKAVVTEIKGRTEDVFRASLQQGGRIDNLEKTVDAIKVPPAPQVQTAPFPQAGRKGK